MNPRKLLWRVAFSGLACIASVACASTLPTINQSTATPSNGYRIAEQTHEYFDIFLSTGLWPVAIAAGPNGELWFSACELETRRPCEIGYYTSSLRQVLVAKNLPYIQSLAYGPDHNFWFTSGSVVGYIDRTGRVTKFEAKSQDENIENGAGWQLWFNQGAGIASITTSGMVTQYSAAGNVGDRIVAGPAGRMYFSAHSPDSLIEPICALNARGVATCFRVPNVKGPLPPTSFYPLVAYQHRIFVKAAGVGQFRFFLMDVTGKFSRINNKHQYTPLAVTNHGTLAAAPGGGANPSFAIVRVVKSNLVGTVYGLTESDIQAECYIFDRIVSTTDGYLWLHGRGAAGGHSCLMRFRERT